MTSKPPRLRSEISFAAVPTAVACGRMFVRSILRQWRLEVLIDDAELIASELVTNAVKATGMIDAGPTTYVTFPHLSLIALRVVKLPTSLIVEVWDTDATAPTIRDVGDIEESGRGLFIVNSLARRWDFYHPKGGGKWVWAELDLPMPLPTRKPKGAKPQTAFDDTEVLQRVHDGLRSS